MGKKSSLRPPSPTKEPPVVQNPISKRDLLKVGPLTNFNEPFIPSEPPHTQSSSRARGYVTTMSAEWARW